MTSTDTVNDRQRGQSLVIFALCLVALIAMTGLVIDGGDTYVMRRSLQNTADAASLAGSYALANGGTAASAQAASLASATSNGYTNGANGVTITTTVVNGGASNSATVQVDITAPHRNYFSGIVGMTSWNVSTTATSISGPPNAALGAMPLIFNKKAVGAFGYGSGAQHSYDEPGTGNQDVPQNGTTFNWTIFCTANGNQCNANTAGVDSIINNDRTVTVTLSEAIGPMNAGAHTALFSSLANFVGTAYPVGIVDDSGNFVGWAEFFITGSVGGSTKQVSGYFQGPTNPSNLSIVANSGAGGNYGAIIVRLTN